LEDAYCIRLAESKAVVDAQPLPVRLSLKQPVESCLAPFALSMRHVTPPRCAACCTG
jgi:hypothetical protein